MAGESGSMLACNEPVNGSTNNVKETQQQPNCKNEQQLAQRADSLLIENGIDNNNNSHQLAPVKNHMANEGGQLAKSSESMTKLDDCKHLNNSSDESARTASFNSKKQDDSKTASPSSIGVGCGGANTTRKSNNTTTLSRFKEKRPEPLKLSANLNQEIPLDLSVKSAGNVPSGQLSSIFNLGPLLTNGGHQNTLETPRIQWQDTDSLLVSGNQKSLSLAQQMSRLSSSHASTVVGGNLTNARQQFGLCTGQGLTQSGTRQHSLTGTAGLTSSTLSPPITPGTPFGLDPSLLSNNSNSNNSSSSSNNNAAASRASSPFMHHSQGRSISLAAASSAAAAAAFALDSPLQSFLNSPLGCKLSLSLDKWVPPQPPMPASMQSSPRHQQASSNNNKSSNLRNNNNFFVATTASNSQTLRRSCSTDNLTSTSDLACCLDCRGTRVAASGQACKSCRLLTDGQEHHSLLSCKQDGQQCRPQQQQEHQARQRTQARSYLARRSSSSASPSHLKKLKNDCSLHSSSPNNSTLVRQKNSISPLATKSLSNSGSVSNALASPSKLINKFSYDEETQQQKSNGAKLSTTPTNVANATANLLNIHLNSPTSSCSSSLPIISAISNPMTNTRASALGAAGEPSPPIASDPLLSAATVVNENYCRSSSSTSLNNHDNLNQHSQHQLQRFQQQQQSSGSNTLNTPTLVSPSQLKAGNLCFLPSPTMSPMSSVFELPSPLAMAFPNSATLNGSGSFQASKPAQLSPTASLICVNKLNKSESEQQGQTLQNASDFQQTLKQTLTTATRENISQQPASESDLLRLITPAWRKIHSLNDGRQLSSQDGRMEGVEQAITTEDQLHECQRRPDTVIPQILVSTGTETPTDSPTTTNHHQKSMISSNQNTSFSCEHFGSIMTQQNDKQRSRRCDPLGKRSLSPRSFRNRVHLYHSERLESCSAPPDIYERQQQQQQQQQQLTQLTARRLKGPRLKVAEGGATESCLELNSGSMHIPHLEQTVIAPNYNYHGVSSSANSVSNVLAAQAYSQPPPGQTVNFGAYGSHSQQPQQQQQQQQQQQHHHQQQQQLQNLQPAMQPQQQSCSHYHFSSSGQCQPTASRWAPLSQQQTLGGHQRQGGLPQSSFQLNQMTDSASKHFHCTGAGQYTQNAFGTSVAQVHCGQLQPISISAGELSRSSPTSGRSSTGHLATANFQQHHHHHHHQWNGNFYIPASQPHLSSTNRSVGAFHQSLTMNGFNNEIIGTDQQKLPLTSNGGIFLSSNTSGGGCMATTSDSQQCVDSASSSSSAVLLTSRQLTTGQQQQSRQMSATTTQKHISQLRAESNCIPSSVSSIAFSSSSPPPSIRSNNAPEDVLTESEASMSSSSLIEFGSNSNNNNNNNNNHNSCTDFSNRRANSVLASVSANDNLQAEHLGTESKQFNCETRRNCSSALESSSSSDKLIDISHNSTGTSSATNQQQYSAKKYHCDQCTKSFTRSDMLTRHKRLHSGDRPFQCSECKQEFSRSDHLSTHMRTHTGEKPYKCKLCSYSACRKDMITRHMKVHNRAIGPASSTALLASDEQTTNEFGNAGSSAMRLFASSHLTSDSN